MLGSVQNSSINNAALSSLLAMQRASGIASHLRAGSAKPAMPAQNPATLVSTENLRSTLAYLDAQTSANQRGMAIADTADASLGQVSDLLNQAKTLATANANTAGLSAEEKQANQMEIDSILASVDRVSASSKFGDVALLDGNYKMAGSGASLSVAQVSVETLSLSALKSGGASNLITGDASAASASIDAAINTVAKQRASIGAFSKGTLQTQMNISANSRLEITSAVALLQNRDAAVESAMHIREQLLSSTSVQLSKLTRTSSGNVLWLVNPMTLKSTHVVSHT